jgi:hypothetical protein
VLKLSHKWFTQRSENRLTAPTEVANNIIPYLEEVKTCMLASVYCSRHGDVFSLRWLELHDVKGHALYLKLLIFEDLA